MAKRKSDSSPQRTRRQSSLKDTASGREGLSFFKVMVGVLVVILSSIVSLTLDIGFQSNFMANSNVQPTAPIYSGLSASNDANPTVGVNSFTQHRHGNGNMFAEARETNNQIQNQPMESTFNNLNSFKNIGSTQYVKQEEASELVSLDSMMHVNSVTDMGLDYNTRSTIVDSNIPEKVKGQETYIYYYYDSVSQSFHLHEKFTTLSDKPSTSFGAGYQQQLALSGKYAPTLCKGGEVYGYSDWHTLQKAVHELGDAYSLAVKHWKDYNGALSEYEMIKFLYDSPSSNVDGDSPSRVNIQPPPPLPGYMVDFLEVSPDPFEICPKATIRPPLHGRHNPITVNAEDIVIQCDSCIIDAPGTHFAFGPHAKNVHIRGLTLMGATASSVIFRHDGADVSFEDCFWSNNDGIGLNGAVADMNSTSSVKFYRCEISDTKASPRANGNVGGANGFVSSLTMRTGN